MRFLSRKDFAGLRKRLVGRNSVAYAAAFTGKENPVRGEPKAIKVKLGQLLRSPMRPFPPAGERIDVPDNHGVYIIYDPKGRVGHVGRTVRGKRGLYQRLNNHLHGSSSFTDKALNGKGSVLRNGYKYRYIEVENNRLRALLEAYAIGQLCPEHLGDGSVG